MTKLIYKSTGLTVALGDKVVIDGEDYTVDWFGPPRHAASEGHVTLKNGDWRNGRELYVSVVGMKWIERTDGRNE